MLSMSLKHKTQLLAVALVSALAGSALSGTSLAEQTNMISARQSLHTAIDYLRAASPDKGGHRENAINLIRQAIGEINLGIQYANQHGNG